jgi:dTDP-4-dehydrorhamnose 3,5-epimerase-like enzyme
VCVTQGSVYDVAIDMRRSSFSFGQWYGIELSAENNKQLWVPAGFAQGLYITSETAEFVYLPPAIRGTLVLEGPTSAYLLAIGEWPTTQPFS